MKNGSLPSASRCALRDAESATELGALLGRELRGEREQSVEALLAEFAHQECVAARACVYVANERVVDHPAGRLLRAAAAREGVQLYFDLPAGGLTRKLMRVLVDEAPVGSASRFAYLDRSKERLASFHPKLISFDVRNAGGEWTVTLVGSGNLTLGGLRTNDELGVLSVRRKTASPTGWSALDEAFERYAREATPVDDDTPLPESADEQRVFEGALPHPMDSLRDYQQRAAEALVAAYAPAAVMRWRGALLALPPAAGKTAIALVAALRLFEGSRPAVRRAIWISPEPELARQAFRELRRITDRAPNATRALEAYFLSRRQVQSLPEAEELEASPEEVVRALVQTSTDDASDRRQILFIGKDKLQSLLERLDVSLEGWAELVIVDEAHHSIAKGWSEVLDQLRPRTVFGLTATPYVSRPESKATTTLLNRYPLGKEPWINYFPDGRRAALESHPHRGGGGQVAFAQSATDFLSEDQARPPALRVLAMPTLDVLELRDADGARLTVRPKSKSKIPPHRRLESSLQKLEDDGLAAGAFEKLGTPASITKYRTRHLEEKGAVADPRSFAEALAVVDDDALRCAKEAMKLGLVVLFARGTGHAELLKRQAEWLGIPSHEMKVVHTKDRLPPGLRRFEVRNLARAGRGLLVCVDMLSEGTDLRKADTVILTRWTTSERLHWQMIGRGLRGPGSGGTERVTIRLYDLEFILREEDEEAGEALGGASRLLIEELEQAGVRINRRPLPVAGATSTKPAAPPSKKTPSSSSGGPRSSATNEKDAKRPQNRWSGPMTLPSVSRLKDLPTGVEYEYWIVTEAGNATKRRPTKNPHRAVTKQRETRRRSKERYVVVRRT